MIAVEITINEHVKMRVSAHNAEPDCTAWPCPCRNKAHAYRCVVQFEDDRGKEHAHEFTIKHVRSEGMHRLAYQVHGKLYLGEQSTLPPA